MLARLKSGYVMVKVEPVEKLRPVYKDPKTGIFIEFIYSWSDSPNIKKCVSIAAMDGIESNDKLLRHYNLIECLNPFTVRDAKEWLMVQLTQPFEDKINQLMVQAACIEFGEVYPSTKQETTTLDD